MTQTTKRKYRNDLLFITILVVTVVILGAGMYFLRSGGDTVTVTVDGAAYGTYPLAVDTVVDIPTEEGHNRLVIRDCKAYMEYADCPDGICAAHRPISRQGESIVCLPHKVVVTVVTTDDNAPDIVV